MKKLLTSCLPVFFLLIPVASLLANDIRISNIRIASVVPGDGYALVSFDLGWSNSWRVSAAPQNMDAAWLFIKYRDNGGEWKHAWLNDTGHSTGTGTGAMLGVGLLNDKLSFQNTTNPGLGCLIYRNADGTGAFSVTGMQLRWNYGANGLSNISGADIRVYAVEMVLAPSGSFFAGDATSTNTLRQIGSTASFQVTAAGGAIKVNTINSHDDTQIEGSGIWVDGDGGISKSAAAATDMNVDFPTGFSAFYCMKYEISQGQYRDFLNTLSRTQQNLRTATDISGTSIANRFVMTGSATVQNRNGLRCDATLPSTGPIEFYCDLDADGVKNESSDGEWIACNFLSWADGTAYLDWSGLRPMTELEYEKICRGPVASVAGEYAWGTSGIAGTAYTLSGGGTGSEGIATNFSTTAGNASYATTDGTIDGPLRVGIFPGNASGITRARSGAGYYGAMELSGNVYERTVTIGNATGRAFTGLHGDGQLDVNGAADVSAWPGADAQGGGFRGGVWSDNNTVLRTSDRYYGAHVDNTRGMYGGFRGCRTVAASGGIYCGAKVSATQFKYFMCHNLGAANTSADPFTPGWEINGAYWQWGRSAQAAAGPSGSGSGQANEAAVSGWNTASAPDGSWTDVSKTANDPCPPGFRIPTRSQWDGVIANNTATNVGTNWTSGATNFSTGKKFGNDLMLPAAGFRLYDNGILTDRGNIGFYHSSSESVTTNAWNLVFFNDSINTSSNYRTYGLSVRCIAE